MNNLDPNTMFMFLSTMAQQFAPGGPASQAASTAQPPSVAPAAQPAAQLGAALTNTAPPPRATTYTNLAQHQALGPDLLYTALIGSQPPSHSELQAFFLGLKLPCSNGFDFMQVLCSHPGGSATFLSHTWTSVIHDFDSLKPHLVVALMSPLLIGEIAQPGSPALTMDLEDLLHRFLQGSGAPCPALLEEAIPRLSKLISFDQIDSPAFRSKALCWATTGSPHVQFDDQHHIVIHFVGPEDLGYDTSLAQLSVARIPLVYLVDLCSRTYPARDHEGNDTEPFTL
ncbi:hypothetical protein B0H14DRAFT_3450163 [Mycena olivaceomarginata]|nr:hypothetical protein B0H14DRAFT_3450163 [Mycena olivaceomarginata]